MILHGVIDLIGCVTCRDFYAEKSEHIYDFAWCNRSDIVPYMLDVIILTTGAYYHVS